MAGLVVLACSTGPVTSAAPALAMTSSSAAGGGGLDTSWGNQGRLAPDGGSLDFAGRELLRQGAATLSIGTVPSPAAGGPTSLLLQRVLSGGRFDPTFGSRGKQTIVLPDGASLSDAAVDSTGRILLLGAVPSDTGSGSSAELLRLAPNGPQDTTFGASGVVTLPPPVAAAVPTSLIVQPDDRLVVAFPHDTSSSIASTDLELVGLLADGSPDPSFGTAGHASFDPGGDSLRASVVPGGDGRLLVAGVVQTGSTQRSLLARLDPQGHLDRSFAGSGMLRFRTGYAGGIRTATVLPDGAITAVGAIVTQDDQFQAVAARITDAGALDPRFGTQGLKKTPASATPVEFDQAIATNGRLVLSELVGDGPIYGRLVGLDPVTGHQLTDFGSNGVARLGTGQTAPIRLITDGTGMLIMLDTWTSTGYVRVVIQRRL